MEKDKSMSIYILPADWETYLIYGTGPVPEGVGDWLDHTELPRRAVQQVKPSNAEAVWQDQHDASLFRGGCECLPYLVDDATEQRKD